MFTEVTTTAPPPATSVAAPSSRLVSLDALRGFDMCWILGLEALVIAALKHLSVPGKTLIIDQLEHAAWEGFHFYDLIFPLFLFIAGVSMALALPKRVARQGTGAAVRHLLFRTLVLFVLGLTYSGGLKDGLDHVRWLGVLQRIALASCGAGLLSLKLSSRNLAIITVAILGTYWALLAFIPVPGIGAGHYAEGQNLTNYLDAQYLPGRKYDGDHDPEGILSNLPAIATGLLGVLAGRWLAGSAQSKRKVLGLLAAGAVLLAVGWLWHPYFPVVKKLWTSSFVLVAGGWSCVLLGVFYAIVDVAGWKKWTTPFVWVGANPIFLYVCSGLGFFSTVSRRITGPAPGPWGWLPPLITFVLMLLTARYLYRKGVYIKA